MGFLSKLFGGAVETAPVRSGKTGTGTCHYGPKMPAEENQYSYPGTYEDYFLNLFYETFPEYQVRKDYPNYDAVVFHLERDGREALVVEVMSERCSAQKLRQDCWKQNLPYLRFYHNHDGWWNTRSYVTDRVSKALNR